MAPCWSKQELPNIHGSTSDVTADQIGIHCFKCRWRENPPRQYGISEPGGEPLDLTFEPLERVHRRSVGDMTVGPSDVPTLGRPRRIEQARLRQQHKRLLRVFTAANRCLGAGYLSGGPAQVHGGSPRARSSSPPDRTGECIIHFEGTGAVAKSRKPALITYRQ